MGCSVTKGPGPGLSCLPVRKDAHEEANKCMEDGGGDPLAEAGLAEAGERVVEDDAGDHAGVEEGGEVVVEVEDAAHHPERDVVQRPPDHEPRASVEGPRLPLPVAENGEINFELL